eukprot:TRINITY_DN6627_c0_g2_i1.p1 TRINITY_DN6627_c0_g2~~TRINITY_DN6627_c0_g2_i1.p1  ORF type:complete len:366 (+),score=74.52 TRINITY_DN6627_c0_g2_i1:118-1215(+)
MMYRGGIFIVLLLVSVWCEPDFSYYHTSDQIDERLKELENSCKAKYKLRTISKSPKILAVDITGHSGLPEEQRTKVFTLFGEHAREMISPETGLSLVETLCGNKKSHRVDVPQLLEKTNFRLVLNANPESRRAVERGEHCLRENPNGVDLNRNWNAHWKHSEDHRHQTSSGKHPFSEEESSTVEQSLASFSPNVFLTVHSGTLGMYTPYAYSKREPIRNENAMIDVTENLNQKYCNCPAGAAGKEVGYLSPGTCLDYAYDKLKVDYAFAWEIYSGRKKDRAGLVRQRRAKELVEEVDNIDDEDDDDIESCFIESRNRRLRRKRKTHHDCFPLFNPVSHQEYHSVVDNWTTAILDLASQVSSRNAS